MKGPLKGPLIVLLIGARPVVRKKEVTGVANRIKRKANLDTLDTQDDITPDIKIKNALEGTDRLLVRERRKR